MPKQNFEVDLKKWHATTREKLVRTARNDCYDEKWGRFIPRQRLNVDQSPLPFAVTTKRTYKHMEKGGQQHNPKRQCTFRICFRPTGDQPKLGIIFRGTGKWISEDEKKAYQPDIDVYFQENAWADTKVSVEWVEKTLTEAVRGDDRFVLFCNNLTGQTWFKEAVAKLGGIVWYRLPGATDLWQPVECISSHNKTLLSNYNTAPTQQRNKQCNCRTKDECALQGKCLEMNVVHQAIVTTDTETESYVGLATNFKESFRNHTTSFRHVNKRNSTELSKHVWKLKDAKKPFNIAWKVLRKCKPYNNIQ